MLTMRCIKVQRLHLGILASNVRHDEYRNCLDFVGTTCLVKIKPVPMGRHGQVVDDLQDATPTYEKTKYPPGDRQMAISRNQPPRPMFADPTTKIPTRYDETLRLNGTTTDSKWETYATSFDD